MKDSRPTVNGDRTCRNCKGLCHMDSVRTTFHSTRQQYYCRSCAELTPVIMSGIKIGTYERVDVISK